MVISRKRLQKHKLIASRFIKPFREIFKGFKVGRRLGKSLLKEIMRSYSLARCLATVASGEKLKVLSVLYRAGPAASNPKLLGIFKLHLYKLQSPQILLLDFARACTQRFLLPYSTKPSD